MKDFNFLVNTFKSSIKTWDYFVNWNKVFKNSSELEIILNKLNYLLGKEDLKSEFSLLYQSNPDIIKAFPLLLAVRENTLEIFNKKNKSSEFYDFSKNSLSVDSYFEFLEKTGLTNLFKKDKIKNLVDYLIGVEVGLDSNGRKNRGGTIMEEIVETFLIEFCKRKNLEYISQASSKDIKKKWNFNLNINISVRKFDFAIYNPSSKKLKLVEANFYNGGGSKLKAVCGEFRNLFDELNPQGIDFIWITDGLGWETAKKPLEETYNHIEYVFNLKMIEEGVLDNLEW
jgi:hypothetical protein